jgi:hypothetical protein
MLQRWLVNFTFMAIVVRLMFFKVVPFYFWKILDW